MNLCYVKDHWAFFTSQPISKQWGDDWDDAPYEHNAGEPYPYLLRDNEEGEDPWEIVKVAWDGDLETPADRAGLNSNYSVEEINQGRVAWLQSPGWSGKKIFIMAGASIEEFTRLVRESGGDVYVSAGR